MKKLITTTLLLLSVSALAQVQKQDNTEFSQAIKKVNHISQLIDVAEGTFKKNELQKHIIVMERLVELRPYNADFHFSLAKAYSMVDEKSKSYNTLLTLQKAGMSYPVGDKEGFDNIRKHNVFAYIEKGMVANSESFGVGKQVYTVDKNYSGMLFENLAYDSKTDSFLVASIRSGGIYRLNDSGKPVEFIKPSTDKDGPWGAVDLEIDNNNDVLWVASSTMPQYNGTTEDNFGKSMIVKYQLSTGKLLEKIQYPGQPVLLNALHLMASGDLIVLNTFKSQLLKLPTGKNKLEELITLGAFTSIQSISSDETGSYLYVADYEQGLFGVDLKQKKVFSIDNGLEANLGGIDDVFYHQGDILAIQSGIQPKRVIRVQLIQKVKFGNILPLEASHPMFKSLSKGTITSKGLFYFANSQWDKMSFDGNLLAEETWEDLAIIQTPLRYKQDELLSVKKEVEDFKKKQGIK